MAEAYIIDAVRTPVGRRGGGLAAEHSADLGAHVLKGLVDRTGVDAGAVEDVVFGCCDTIGPQAGDIARSCWLAAGLPQHVPGVTIDRQCGSSQQAVHFAAQGVMAGAYDVVVAAGVECMTRVPMGASIVENMGFPFSQTVLDRYKETGLPPQGIGADMIADEYGITREDLDRFAAQSQQRAAKATEEGRFKNEIIPVPVKIEDHEEMMTADEGIRPEP